MSLLHRQIKVWRKLFNLVPAFQTKFSHFVFISIHYLYMTFSRCQGDDWMYKNKSAEGKLNISGEKIAKYRKQLTPKVSQRALADMLQLQGVDLDKNAIQKMESG